MVAVTQDQAQRNAAQAPRPRILPAWVMMLYPLIALFLPTRARRRLADARAYTLAWLERRRAFVTLIAQVEREARLYRSIIIERLAAMGFSWRTRRGDNDPDEKTRRRRKTVKVKIELTRYNEHAIWMKIHVRSRKLFGSKNELPYRVYVNEILDDKTTEELSFALQHRVVAKRSNPSRGAWLVVYRNESAGLLPEYIRFHSMLEHLPVDVSQAPFILGVGENNTIHETSLEDCPHILIGGATRSGKSNMLNCIIAPLIRFSDHEQVKFIMIDPKQVELSYYESAPHMERPVVYDLEQAMSVLREVNAIIDLRTSRLKQRAKDITTFNKRYPDESIPRLVVVIEEVGSLWEDNRERDTVMRLLRRIANMGRAVGVHLILCTQLPTVEVIPSLVRVNMWLRIAGRVTNHHESRVILGASDAAYLPEIRGRMVYGKDANISVIQVPHILDDDIQEAISIARGRAAGLTRMVGAWPEIIPDALARWVYRMHGGALIIGRLRNHLRPLGITQRMLDEWLENTFNRRIEGWNVELRNAGIYYLVPDGQPAPAPDARPILRRLGLPPPVLMLPAPRQPDPEPEPEPPAAAPIPVILSPAEVFEQFLAACCEFGNDARAESRAIYDAYRRYCSTHQQVPDSQKRVGLWLKEAGMIPVKYSDRRYWRGVRLINSSDIVDTTDTGDVSGERVA